MESRYIWELLLMAVILLAGIVLKRITKKKLKDIEDSGKIIKGQEGKILNVGEEDEM